MADVLINSLRYVLRDDGRGGAHIRETRQETLAPPVRSDGRQRQSGVVPWEQYNLPPPTGGVGLPKILARDVDNPAKLRRSKVSELDTRFVPITLARLHADSTEPAWTVGSQAVILRATAEFKGDLWGLFEVPASASNGLLVRKYTGSSTAWTGGILLGAMATGHIIVGVDSAGGTVTITVNGTATVLTAVSGSAGTRQFSIDSGDDATIAAGLVTAINAHVTGVSAATIDQDITVTADGDTWKLEIAENLSSTTLADLPTLQIHQALDLAVVGNYIIALAVEGDDHRIYRTTAGATTWAAASTQPTANVLVDAPTAGENLRAGKLVTVSSSGVVWAALWDEDSQTVDLWRSTNAGDDWTSQIADAVFSASGVLGRALYFDLNGDLAPCFATAEEVFAVDLSGPTTQKILTMPSDANNARVMTTWANPFRDGVESLYISLADGTYLEYTWRVATGNSVALRRSGPNIDGGLDSDQEGYGTWGTSSSGFLYIAAGGSNANQSACIWATDGRGFADPEEPGSGWHFIRQHGTANQEIDVIALSNRDDGTMRLHYAARTAATVTDTLFILNPNSHPLSGDTINYQAAGTMDRPRIDGGFPHDSAAWFEVALEADDLSASTSGEYINLDRGVNAATPSTDIGNILSGTRVLKIASGAGVSGREFQLRENYVRDGGNTAHTPKGYDVEVKYRKKLNKTTEGSDSSDSYRTFVMDIDIQATASLQVRPAEDVLNDLFDAEGNIIGQSFEVATIGTSGNPRFVDLRVTALEHTLEAISQETHSQPSTVRFVTIVCNEVP